VSAPSSKHDPELDALRARWLLLIRHELPEAARSRPGWPIRLDHCFARVILDHLCGRPWREVVAAPAYKHLTAEQLRAGISVGEAVIEGAIDLNRLNRESLHRRHAARNRFSEADQGGPKEA
jgi:hypothetical protein